MSWFLGMPSVHGLEAGRAHRHVPRTHSTVRHGTVQYTLLAQLTPSRASRATRASYKEANDVP